MLQITYQHKLEDLKAFADYMAGTEQGRKYGQESFWNVQWHYLAVSSLGGLLVAVISLRAGFGLAFLFVSLLLDNVILLLRSRFKPQYYFARQGYLAAQKSISAKALMKFQLPTTLTADDEWLEISSPMSLRRCNWSCVEKIDLTLDFIFIHEGGCPIVYVPRRDFSSEQPFKEFGQTLIRLREEREAQISAQAAP